MPFEQWDWQKEDPDFYQSYMRLPDSKDPETLRQVKWNRYYQSLPEGDAKMRDFRPKTFFKRMKMEIFLFTAGIAMGLFCKVFESLIFYYSRAMVFQKFTEKRDGEKQQ